MTERKGRYGALTHERNVRSMAAVFTLLGYCCWPLLLPATPVVHGFVRAVSDYVYRAYSKSADAPTLQGQVALTLPAGLHAGLAASLVDFGGAGFEANPYLGLTRALSRDWRLDWVLAGYWFNRAVFGQGSAHFEPTMTLSFRDLARLRLGAAIEPYGASASTPYAEVGGSYPMTDVTTIASTFGYEHGRAVTGYDVAYWNLGVTHYVNPHCAVDLRYHDAKSIGAERPTLLHQALETTAIGARVVVSLSVGF